MDQIRLGKIFSENEAFSFIECIFRKISARLLPQIGE